ncbi:MULTISPECIES: hypothetical protein [Streptomyces]|uniref:Uncharacterized protein n=2 Tax=Streptomyces TaxID=1883 RepID=A0ABS9JF66_9ACTN|nr:MULTISPECIES: hypothetical protein [Streptomyces]MYU28934.1 hypothetical protein [Streptomyces sp. SID7810]CUW29979.1 hypothetical protein TUE45_04695 [Streptomyces reticuli]AKN71487.1 hypothetical protein QR97_18260 [Streptomyces sp. PBH53]MCE0447700.1 hypothetical protein [Streptomyces tricolor]MCG0064209.1 hypothetical protein [Streptomyces tricolor]
MIKHVPHRFAERGPAGLTLALTIASELHVPVPAPRVPRAQQPAVTPVPQLMGLRTSAARPHRRKVPLHRLTTVAA